jgi:hypothetical protein
VSNGSSFFLAKPWLPADPRFKAGAARWSLVGYPESVYVMMDPVLEKPPYMDRDDVEAAKVASLPPYPQKITCRVHYVSQFHVVDRLNGVYESPFLSRPNLNEDDYSPFQGHDVDLPHWAQEVSLEDAVAAKQEVKRCCALASGAGAEVWGFAFEEHVEGSANERPEFRIQ